MYEKQTKHFEFNVFPEHNVRNVIFRFLVYTVGTVRGNPNLFLFGHVRFITEASQIFVNAFAMK